MFCKRLKPSGERPLLDSLVRKLASMLESSTKRSVQEMAVADMAAMAVIAEEEFVPYVAGVISCQNYWNYGKSPCILLQDELWNAWVMLRLW